MSFDWLGPSVTLVLGVSAFFVGGANERRRDRNQAARDKTARDEAARERREDAKHQFQLDNYLLLQDAVREYARACTVINMADREIVKRHGHFTQSPPGLSDEEFQSRATYLRLINRVTDDELREALKDFLTVATQAAIPPSDKSISKEDALAWVERGAVRLSASMETANNMLGERLRVELRR